MAFVFGLSEFIGIKTFPEWALEDYGYYADAYWRDQRGGNPYAEQTIGLAFLYPPPALLYVGVFETFFPNQMMKIAVHWAFSAGLVIWLVQRCGSLVGKPVPPMVWATVILSLPLAMSTYLGQINLTVASLSFGYFILLRTRPVAAGMLLAAAVSLKVSPLLLLVLAFRHDWFRVGLGFVAGLAFLGVAAGLVFGFESYTQFIVLFSEIADANVLGSAKLSVKNVAYLTFISLEWDFNEGHLELVQWAVYLTGAAIIVLAMVRHWTDESLIVPFAVVLFVQTITPNILWQHHFTFLLPAIILLLIEQQRTWTFIAALMALFAGQFLATFGPPNLVGLFVQTVMWLATALLVFSPPWRKLEVTNDAARTMRI